MAFRSRSTISPMENAPELDFGQFSKWRTRGMPQNMGVRRIFGRSRRDRDRAKIPVDIRNACKMGASTRSKLAKVQIRAFPGKVDTGFPQGNATKQGLLERFPIQCNRETL